MISHQINQNDSNQLLIETLLKKIELLESKVEVKSLKIVDNSTNEIFKEYPEKSYSFVKLFVNVLNQNGNYSIEK